MNVGIRGRRRPAAVIATAGALALSVLNAPAAQVKNTGNRLPKACARWVRLRQAARPSLLIPALLSAGAPTWEFPRRSHVRLRL